jgi:hypothetical protein
VTTKAERARRDRAIAFQNQQIEKVIAAGHEIVAGRDLNIRRKVPKTMSAAPLTKQEVAFLAALKAAQPQPGSPEHSASKLREVARCLGHETVSKKAIMAALEDLFTSSGIDSGPASKAIDPKPVHSEVLTKAQLAICHETGCDPKDFAKVRRAVGQTSTSLAAARTKQQANAVKALCVGKR